MPKRLSRDWDPIRIECTVIAYVLPGLVSVRVSMQRIELDEGLAHYDPMAFKILEMLSKEIAMRRSFVPADLHRPNSVFWLNVGNDRLYRIYRNVDDPQPAVVGTDHEAT